jgi:hypothetical protein
MTAVIANFYAPPNERGAVEIGYEIAEPYRRRARGLPRMVRA